MIKLEKQAKTKEVIALYKAILQLKDIDECSRFFRDLLTIEEIQEFSRRWQVAQMLAKEISFSEIEKQTGMSSVTIARINYWIHHGMNGYKLMINNLELNKKK